MFGWMNRFKQRNLFYSCSSNKEIIIRLKSSLFSLILYFFLFALRVWNFLIQKSVLCYLVGFFFKLSTHLKVNRLNIFDFFYFTEQIPIMMIIKITGQIELLNENFAFYTVQIQLTKSKQLKINFLNSKTKLMARSVIGY